MSTPLKENVTSNSDNKKMFQICILYFELLIGEKNKLLTLIEMSATATCRKGLVDTTWLILQ